MAHLKSSAIATAALSAAVFAFAVPVSAQQRLSLAERVERLEQQQAGGQGGNAVDLVNQIQQLQSQVQQLQGQVEELKHQLDESKQRSKDQYIDLDSRIGRLEGHAPGGAAPYPEGPGAAGARSDAPPPDIELGAGAGAGAGDEGTARSPAVSFPLLSRGLASAVDASASASTPATLQPNHLGCMG